MILTVRNDFGDEFQHHCREFIGYDVFIEARELWGYNWNTYLVINGSEVLEKVINPETLDPENAQRIH